MKNNLIGSSLLAVVIAGLSFFLRPSVGGRFEQDQRTIHWGNLSQKLVAAGVVDDNQFPEIHDLPKDLRLDDENAYLALNTLWAFGLANKNEILETGPMMSRGIDKVSNFASTGGWTLAQGNAMDHYSVHEFVRLTPEQQELVEKTSKNIYRPCCRNSTYFPDCNHGMAMLGLLELLAKEGATEEEMYAVAEEVNALWFPPTPTSSGCTV